MFIKSVIVTLFFTLSLMAQDSVGPWNLKELFQTPKWQKTEKAPKTGMTGLLYDSIPYKEVEAQLLIPG